MTNNNKCFIKNDEAFKYIYDTNVTPVINENDSKYDGTILVGTFKDMLMYLLPNAKVEFVMVDDKRTYCKMYIYSVTNKGKKYEFRFMPYMNIVVILAIENFEDINKSNVSRLKRIILSRLPEYLDTRKRSSLLPKHVKYHINDLFILRLSNYNKIRSEIFKIVNYIFNGERGLTYRSRSKLFYVIQNVRDGKKFKCYEKTLKGQLCEGV
jgi:hypothetical protein